MIIHGSSQNKLDSLKKEILETCKDVKNIELVQFDFNSLDFLKKYIDVLKSIIERTDILIVCYGPFLQKELHKTTMEEWEQTVFWNYTFPGQLVTCALNTMMKKQFGRIIVFGGTRTNSINGFRTNPVYGGAKTALCSLVKSVAAEYGKYGITCNGILPGFIETEYLSEETKLMLAKKMPQGKLIGAESIAETALFLLKQDAMNGVLLNVDEGWMP